MAVDCQGVMGGFFPGINLSLFSLDFFSKFRWPLVARE